MLHCYFVTLILHIRFVASLYSPLQTCYHFWISQRQLIDLNIQFFLVDPYSIHSPRVSLPPIPSPPLKYWCSKTPVLGIDRTGHKIRAKPQGQHHAELHPLHDLWISHTCRTFVPVRRATKQWTMLEHRGAWGSDWAFGDGEGSRRLRCGRRKETRPGPRSICDLDSIDAFDNGIGIKLAVIAECLDCMLMWEQNPRLLLRMLCHCGFEHSQLSSLLASFVWSLSFIRIFDLVLLAIYSTLIIRISKWKETLYLVPSTPSFFPISLP